MTIKEILQNFKGFYGKINEIANMQDEYRSDGEPYTYAEIGQAFCNYLFDKPVSVDEAIDEVQAVLDKGLTCASCKYGQDDLADGRPCACLTCALSHLTSEQQKNEINHEAAC